MATFTDDFNRADGAVGNGWDTGGTAPQIASGQVHVTAAGWIERIPFTSPPVLRAFALVQLTTLNSRSVRVFIKKRTGAREMYSAHVTGTGTSRTVYLTRWTAGGQIGIASDTFTTAAATWATVGISYDAGTLTAYYNGVAVLTGTDSTYSDGYGVGIYPQHSDGNADDFNCDDGINPTLAVDPSPIEEFGPDPTLTFTGTDTAWTPGTPGSPTFTVDKGSLSNQQVQSATHATADYALPLATDTARFTDPSTGEYVDVALSSSLNVTAGGDNSDVLAVLGTPDGPETVLGDLNTILDAIAPTDVANAPTDLIDFLNGTDFSLTLPGIYVNLFTGVKSHTAPDNGLWKTMIALLAYLGKNLDLGIDTNTEVHTISTLAHYSLLDVMNTIRGTSTIDNTNLWDYLHDLRTVSGYTLGDILLAIAAVRGTDERDLTEIYDLLSTVAPPDLTPITDYLDWITNTHTVSLTLVNGKVDALSTALTDLHSDVDTDYLALTGQADTHQTELLSAIAGVLSDLTTQADTHQTETLTAVTGVHDDLAADYAALANLINTMTEQGNHSLHQLYTQLDEVIGHGHAEQITLNDIQGDVHALHNTDLSGVETHLHSIEDKLDLLLAAEPTPTAPVWPGASAVTLGAEVPLTDQLVLAGPLHGVLVTVTGGGSRLSQILVGTRSYLFRAGEITFTNDNGQVEPWQYIGFDQAMYCPKAMALANSARFRVLGGITGTVRPWTIT